MRKPRIMICSDSPALPTGMGELISEYRVGNSICHLERKYGIERHDLSDILQSFGIRLRPRHEYYDYRFIIPGGTDLFWLLGLISTDGYVSHKFVCIELNGKDLDLLRNIKNICHSTHPIHSRKDREEFYLRLPKPFADLCRSYGIVQNKSKIIRLPSIPKKYFYDYLCGCIDGDGSINRIPSGKIRLYLCSASLGFLKDINKILLADNLDGRIAGNAGIFRLSWDTQKTPKICKKIYKNINRSNRKYMVYSEYLKGVKPTPCQ